MTNKQLVDLFYKLPTKALINDILNWLKRSELIHDSLVGLGHGLEQFISNESAILEPMREEQQAEKSTLPAPNLRNGTTGSELADQTEIAYMFDEIIPEVYDHLLELNDFNKLCKKIELVGEVGSDQDAKAPVKEGFIFLHVLITYIYDICYNLIKLLKAFTDGDPSQQLESLYKEKQNQLREWRSSLQSLDKQTRSNLLIHGVQLLVIYKNLYADHQLIRDAVYASLRVKPGMGDGAQISQLQGPILIETDDSSLQSDEAESTRVVQSLDQVPIRSRLLGYMMLDSDYNNFSEYLCDYSFPSVNFYHRMFSERIRTETIVDFQKFNERILQDPKQNRNHRRHVFVYISTNSLISEEALKQLTTPPSFCAQVFDKREDLHWFIGRSLATALALEAEGSDGYAVPLVMVIYISLKFLLANEKFLAMSSDRISLLKNCAKMWAEICSHTRALSTINQKHYNHKSGRGSMFQITMLKINIPKKELRSIKTGYIAKPMIVPPKDWSITTNQVGLHRANTVIDASGVTYGYPAKTGGYLTESMLKMISPSVDVPEDITLLSQKMVDVINKYQGQEFWINYDLLLPIIRNMRDLSVKDSDVWGLDPADLEIYAAEHEEQVRLAILRSNKKIKMAKETYAKMKANAAGSKVRNALSVKHSTAIAQLLEMISFSGMTVYMPIYTDFRGRMYHASSLSPQHGKLSRLFWQKPCNGRKLTPYEIRILKTLCAISYYPKKYTNYTQAYEDYVRLETSEAGGESRGSPRPEGETLRGVGEEDTTPPQGGCSSASAAATPPQGGCTHTLRVCVCTAIETERAREEARLRQSLKAKSPTLFFMYKTILEANWIRYEPSIKMDASASILQVMGLISRSQPILKVSNLLSTEEGGALDPYTEIGKSLVLPSDLTDEELTCYQHLISNRKYIKLVLMTYFYGSKPYIMAQKLGEFSDFEEYGIKVLMKTINRFTEQLTNESVLKDGFQFMLLLKRINDCYPLSSTNTKYMSIQNYYHKKEQTRVDFKYESEGNLVSHRLRFTYYLDQHDKRKSQDALLANLFHTLDAFLAQSVVEACTRNNIFIITIHDCFICSIKDLEQVRRFYTEACAQLYKFNVFRDLIFIEPTTSKISTEVSLLQAELDRMTRHLDELYDLQVEQSIKTSYYALQYEA